MSRPRLSLALSLTLLLGLAACATQAPVQTGPTASLPPPPVDTSPQEAIPTTITEHGLGSYYADRFHGQTTAGGGAMDQNAMTAASKDLPLGTKATVTNLKTGKSVQVEVNDRGPYVPGRIIDVSKRAADELGLDAEKGVAKVKVEARAEDQPTPELKHKVAKIAAAKASRKKKTSQAIPTTDAATK